MNEVLPGVWVGPVWVGSTVTGWQFRCSRSMAPRCAPRGLFADERDAQERAADHWNLHEQES